jgi:hypothetical protein
MKSLHEIENMAVAIELTAKRGGEMVNVLQGEKLWALWELEVRAHPAQDSSHSVGGE